MISVMDDPRPAGVPAPDPDPSSSPPSAPLRAEVELAARGLPATPAQVAWARSRPGPRRVPLPQVGDEVLYRHDSWATPVRATVTYVHPLDDYDDPHLWQAQTDGQGGHVLIEGKPVFIANPDPWPLLHLSVHAAQVSGMIGGFTVETREARLPGSPGWLPLNWATRWRPMPWEV